MILKKLISWKNPSGYRVTTGNDLLVFEQDDTHNTAEKLQTALKKLFDEHPDFTAVVQENAIVEINSRNTTMIVTFLEYRFTTKNTSTTLVLSIDPHVDPVAHHLINRNKSNTATKKKTRKKNVLN